jgi:hypothetical protein
MKQLHGWESAMKLLVVFWVDAGMKTGWQKGSEVDEWADEIVNFLVTTVGFVHAETDEYIVLIQGTTSDAILNPVKIRKESILGIEEK